MTWPQKAWAFSRPRVWYETPLPPDGVIANIHKAAAAYSDVCLRSRSLELIHVYGSSPDALTGGTPYDKPHRALIYDMLHAPVSLLRLRLELVTSKGAVSQDGALMLSARNSRFDESDEITYDTPAQAHRRSTRLCGAAGLVERLRVQCTEAGLLVEVDGYAVTISCREPGYLTYDASM